MDLHHKAGGMANKDYNHLFKLLIIGDSSQCLVKFIYTSAHMMFMVSSQ